MAAARELFWVLPMVRREERRWERLAERIPDRPIREDALTAMRRKRGNVAGAALFATLPRHRDPSLVRTLVAFQLIADFLDDVHERHPTEANGLQLHRAVLDALDPTQPLADYYEHHPWRDDGGYLRALVETCRSSAPLLASYERVRELLVAEGTRARESFCLNHLLDPGRRDAALRDWAERYFPGEKRWTWFELSAAASGQLSAFCLLALAAQPALGDEELAATHAAYWPSLPLITAMLDSFVDQAEDHASGAHMYIAHYESSRRAIARIHELIEEAARGMSRLPDGDRHRVILGCLVTFYLSKDSARSGSLRADTERLIEASGALPKALAPILRTWRLAYSQTSA